jgi:hypothetical protein
MVVEQVAYQRGATAMNTKDEYRPVRDREGVLDFASVKGNWPSLLGSGPDGVPPSLGGCSGGSQIHDAGPLQPLIEAFLEIDDIQPIHLIRDIWTSICL